MSNIGGGELKFKRLVFDDKVEFKPEARGNVGTNAVHGLNQHEECQHHDASAQDTLDLNKVSDDRNGIVILEYQWYPV
jgi:hypothetical protein